MVPASAWFWGPLRWHCGCGMEKIMPADGKLENWARQTWTLAPWEELLCGHCAISCMMGENEAQVNQMGFQWCGT